MSRWKEKRQVDIDGLIARRLFQHSLSGEQGVESVRIRPYSSDIAAAWDVVEEMRRRKVVVRVVAMGERYYCELVLPDCSIVEAALTAPRAICEAALHVLDMEDEP
jgi:hypothetical protein